MNRPTPQHDNRTLWQALLSDGRFLLALTGVALIASGGFALFLCATGHFLPHDVAHLGMDAEQLSRVGNRALVNFMFHDRAAFGGALISIGILYLWLVEFPLKQHQAWAWWTLFFSGVLGFGSFLSYLGYGYLDTWHGVATLALLPIFVGGLIRSWSGLDGPRSWRSALKVPFREGDTSRLRAGTLLYITYGLGLIAAGITITGVGITSVFVKEDLQYIALSREAICSISSPLVPIIAHDRAGFGGGLLSIGVMIVLLALNSPRTRSFHQAMLLAGVAGFASAIGIHFVIGYTNMKHLGPAFVGAVIFLCAWYLSRGRPVSQLHNIPKDTDVLVRA